MHEMHLRQPGFTYSACGSFTKNKERIQKFKETGDSRYIYQNELDKACFQHDTAYGDFKDFTRRIAIDKILRDISINIAKNVMEIWCDGYQRGLGSMVYKFFDKGTAGNGIKNENISDQLLAEELQKPIIWTFKKRKVHSSFIDNIWVADLADMQLISKFNKGILFLLCVVEIFSKYAWVIPFKDKKGITIINAFQINSDGSNRKPDQICIDKDSEFYNRSMKSWLEKSDIEMYSTYNEGKSVAAERFIRTLNKNISIWLQYQKWYILIN